MTLFPIDPYNPPPSLDLDSADYVDTAETPLTNCTFKPHQVRFLLTLIAYASANSAWGGTDFYYGQEVAAQILEQLTT